MHVQHQVIFLIVSLYSLVCVEPLHNCSVKPARLLSMVHLLGTFDFDLIRLRMFLLSLMLFALLFV